MPFWLLESLLRVMFLFWWIFHYMWHDFLLSFFAISLLQSLMYFLSHIFGILTIIQPHNFIFWFSFSTWCSKYLFYMDDQWFPQTWDTFFCDFIGCVSCDLTKNHSIFSMPIICRFLLMMSHRSQMLYSDFLISLSYKLWYSVFHWTNFVDENSYSI